MRMNNLLIVDDELETLEWLKEIFQFEVNLEIDVHTALTARKALDILNKIPCDVVLTDIKMPGIDGITLCSEIKKNWPACQVIFLTAYQDYEDIYKVIKFQDVQYLLKSEDDEVIINTVREAFHKIDSFVFDRSNKSKGSQCLSDASYWIQKEYLNKYLLSNSDEDRKKLSNLKLNVNLNYDFLIFLLRLNIERNEMDLMQEYELHQMLKDNMERFLPDNMKVYQHIMDNHNCILLIQPSDNTNQDWQKLYSLAFGALEYTFEYFEHTTNFTLSAVISEKNTNLNEFKIRVEQLMYLMKAIADDKISVILHADNQYNEIIADKLYLDAETSNKQQRLRYYLQLQKRDQYFQILNEFCQQLCLSISMHDTAALELYYNISTVILQYINENKLNEDIAFKTGLYKLTNANEHSSWQVAKTYLLDISSIIFNLLGNHELNLSDSALIRIEQYITNHPEDDLTLTKLAKVGGFNASYLSRLYKQARGVNITDFIIKVRMERAKTLLKRSTLKINEISEKVGYISAHSFTRAFKVYEGIVPLEYREISDYK